MARKKTRKRRSEQQPAGVISQAHPPITSWKLPRRKWVTTPSRRELLDHADGRRYNPSQRMFPGIRTQGRVIAQAAPQKKVTRPSPLHKLKFKEPRAVLACIRRTQRKEVLHAIGRSGRNGMRTRRTTPTSEISCR